MCLMLLNSIATLKLPNSIIKTQFFNFKHSERKNRSIATVYRLNKNLLKGFAFMINAIVFKSNVDLHVGAGT